MTEGRPVDIEHLSAREAAERWFEAHPLRDPSKNSVIRALVRFIDDDRCVVWPSALRLHHRTGLSEDTVERVLADFDRTGLTVRIKGTGERGGSIVRRVDYERSMHLYPDSESWDECKSRVESRKLKKTEVPAPCGKFNSTEVPAPCGNNAVSTGQMTCVKFPQAAPEVPARADGSSRNGDTEVPANAPRSSRMVRDEGLRVLEPEGFKAGDRGDLIAGRASRLPATDAPPAEHEHEAQRTGGIAAVAKAMVDEFYAHCEANVRSEVEDDCLRFAKARMGIDDMREAIRVAKRQEKRLGRKPRWASVRNVLDGALKTRESVTSGFGHEFGAEAVRAARQLEAVYARHFDKPAWTAGRSRYDMAEWLLWAVTRNNVDEAMFEAACRDAKTVANGKPPTWKHVRVALDVRIAARRHSTPEPATKGKPFFDQPATRAGTVPGNDTRH